MSNKHTNTIILGIETSCDETSAAVFSGKIMLSNIIATQEVHRNFGGVVPELAAVAFTRGPGLPGSLMVGVSFAKSFALALGVPLIEVNHMQAHILAHFIMPDSALNSKLQKASPSFPFLCLTVSGGHTQIVLVRDYLDMEVIGQTLDDAAGEAFDKAAKIMGIPYPGGPLIDKFARDGNPKSFSFPEPQVEGLNFSFSGLKTSFLYFIQKETQKDSNFIEKNKNDLCASLQHTIVNILLKKLSKASVQTGINEIALAGGVSANSGLRNALNVLGEKRKWNIYIPPMQYCTDNAAMIAIAGYFKFLKSDFSNQTATPLTRMEF